MLVLSCQVGLFLYVILWYCAIKMECPEYYKTAGLALQASQHLENTLQQILFLLADQDLIDYDKDKAKSFLDGKESITLGNMIHIMKNMKLLERQQIKTLYASLDARNFLIHRFFVDSKYLMDKKYWPIANEEVDELWGKIQKSNVIMEKVLNKLYESIGIDTVYLEKMYVELLKLYGWTD